MNKLAALQSGSISQEHFETWKRETLEYYSDSFFSDFSSQRKKAKKNKGIKKKPDYSTIQIVSTQEEDI